MNNMLPSYFEYMKPVQPVACNYYGIRKPRLHPPIINHEFVMISDVMCQCTCIIVYSCCNTANLFFNLCTQCVFCSIIMRLNLHVARILNYYLQFFSLRCIL